MLFRSLVELLRKASPQGNDKSLSAKARPVGELLPAAIVDEIDEAEWTEAPDIEETPEPLEAKAPSLVDKSPSTSEGGAEPGHELAAATVEPSTTDRSVGEDATIPLEPDDDHDREPYDSQTGIEPGPELERPSAIVDDTGPLDDDGAPVSDDRSSARKRPRVDAF